MLRDMVSVNEAFLALSILTAIAENYLRGRPNAKFERKDFDSLSNKFLAKLVIRAN